MARELMRGRREVAFIMPHATPLLRGSASTGGAETQILLLARALRERGGRVAIATFARPGDLPTSVDGIDLIPLPPQPPTGERARLVATLVREVDADVFVQRAAGSYTGVVGLVARARRRRFVYSTASDFDFERASLQHDPMARRLFPVGVRCAHAIVVQTEVQAQLCRRAWSRDCTVIRSIAEPAPQRTIKPEAFVWAGRMAPRKRPEAYVQLAARVPHARFWMVGDAPPAIHALAGEVPNLEILPPQPRERLITLLERAVAVVSTSVKEGMPNVFLEAWARGVPALALAHDPDGIIERHSLGSVAGDSMARLGVLASAAWEGRERQTDAAARCRAYVASEHGADEVARRWERVLGLSREPGA